MSDTLKSRTATSSVALIRRALADMRAASANLEAEGAFDEIVRSAETLSGGIKRLSVYAQDIPSKKAPSPTEKSAVEVEHVARVLSAAKNGTCKRCGGLLENE